MKNIILFLIVATTAITTTSCVDGIKLSDEQKEAITGAIIKEIERAPLTKEQMVYVGKWVADDGASVQIYGNGTGNIESDHLSVTGGKTTFTDNTLTIDFMGFGNKFILDAPPYEEDGKMKMKLDGLVYTKQ